MYYKLTNWTMQSCNITGEYRIQYCFGGWVKPKIGKIFIFDSLDNLRYFVGERLYDQRVFECSVMNPTPLSIVCDWVHVSKFKSFWNGNYDYSYPAPVGTVGGDAVMLIKEVTDV